MKQTFPSVSLSASETSTVLKVRCLSQQTYAAFVGQPARCWHAPARRFLQPIYERLLQPGKATGHRDVYAVELCLHSDVPNPVR